MLDLGDVNYLVMKRKFVFSKIDPVYIGHISELSILFVALCVDSSLSVAVFLKLLSLYGMSLFITFILQHFLDFFLHFYFQDEL